MMSLRLFLYVIVIFWVVYLVKTFVDHILYLNVVCERGVWWNRQIFNSEFIAPMDKNNQILLDTLKFHKILLSNRTPLPVNPVFKRILDQIRSILLSVDPQILIFGFLITGFVLILVPVGSNVSSI